MSIAGTGSGMLRCAKNQNRTRNRGTHFKSTAGLPIPVLNPRGAKEACRTTSRINGRKQTDSAIKTYELSLTMEHMGGEQQACIKTY
jgi:hypothetical protein